MSQSNSRPTRGRPGRLRRRIGLAGGAVLVLGATAGCSVNEIFFIDLPEPATEQAEITRDLWNGAWVALWPVGILVWGLMIFSFFAYHKKRRPEVPEQTTYNLPIETLYTVAPLILIVGFFWFTARDQTELLTLSPGAGEASQIVSQIDPNAEPVDQVIQVIGFRWAWAFNYKDEDVYEAGMPFDFEDENGVRAENQDAATTLWLPINQKVRFELTAADVIHSFWVPDWLFKLDAIPGKLNQFEVTPNKLGLFKGKCAELCGVDHARMLFNVKVVTQEEFDAHIEELKKKGQTGQLETGKVNTSGEPNVDGRTL